MATIIPPVIPDDAPDSERLVFQLLRADTATSPVSAAGGAAGRLTRAGALPLDYPATKSVHYPRQSTAPGK